MANEEDPKKAAKGCFDSIGLDPELYRIGHTKARYFALCEFSPFSQYFHLKSYLNSLMSRTRNVLRNIHVHDLCTMQQKLLRSISVPINDVRMSDDPFS